MTMATELNLTSGNKEEFYVCTDGNIYSLPSYVKVVAGVTSCLSIIGSVLLILSYVCFKKTRSKAREIMLNLSLMDFTVACANLIGISMNYNSLLFPIQRATDMRLCVAQGSFGLYSSLSSILWTNALAIYFYVQIILDNDKLTRHCVYWAYVICYGLPLVVTSWFILTKRVGYDPVFSSGWCGLIAETDKFNARNPSVTIFFGYNIFVYITFILIPVIAISLISYLRLAHENLKSVWSMVSIQLICYCLLRI